jgi:hypothetical protein
MFLKWESDRCFWNGKAFTDESFKLKWSSQYGTIQQHKHWTFLYLDHALSRQYFIFLYHSRFVTFMLRKFLSWSRRDKRGASCVGLFNCFNTLCMGPFLPGTCEVCTVYRNYRPTKSSCVKNFTRCRACSDPIHTHDFFWCNNIRTEHSCI